MGMHVGDIGTSIEFTIYDQDGKIVDLSLATSMSIIFEKPDDATIVTQPGSLLTNGKDGVMHYVTQFGDIDQAGTWSAQGVVQVGVSQWKSDVQRIPVDPNLA